MPPVPYRPAGVRPQILRWRHVPSCFGFMSLAGQVPHEAQASFTQVGSFVSTGTESFPALPASSHPVVGTYPYSLILPSIFSLRAEMPR
jgi:hypothetical protein